MSMPARNHNHNPTLTTSPASSPASFPRRRGLSYSYLRTYTHNRLSSLTNLNHSDSSSTAETPTRSALIPPPTTSSDEQPAPHPTLAADPPDEPLLPPNPFPSPLNTLNHQPAQGDGASTSRNTVIGGISKIMARHRADSRPTNSEAPKSSVSPGPKDSAHNELPSLRLIPHQDPRASRPSLTFPPMARTLPNEDSIIRVGRYSERDAAPNPPPNVPSAAPVGFKSKVVSRKHCEFWCDNGQWYIKDVKSSSGTFLNHIRLSQPSVESRPYPVNDGDVVQLGIDFRGGEEMIFRCVKIRCEINRGWQKSLNNFNVATHKRLLGKAGAKKDSDNTTAHSSECAICLMSIASFSLVKLSLLRLARMSGITNVDGEDAMDDWVDEDGSHASVAGADDAEVQSSDGPQEAAKQALNHEDEALADITSRQLSVRNGIDPPPESVEYAGVDAPPPSRAALSPASDVESSTAAPTLLNRRNGRHVTPPRHMPLPSMTEEELANMPLSRDAFLRPATSTQPFLGNGDFLHREALLGDAITPGSELGPMTPTNNAGPFVFDGSAGRDSIRQPGHASPRSPRSPQSHTAPGGSNGVTPES
ncbi:MAG: hypothetical protein LQ350_006006 [Teloschistes chrysophthalmus]|nr:MAG: hypothetical protein LQ350_006006 [Niorma chrysophthalma]